MSDLLDKYLEEIQLQELPLLAASVAIGAVQLMIAAGRIYKNNLTKAAKACKDLPDREKAICMLRGKVAAKNAELQALKAGIGKCAKAKNPEACKTKVANKMQKLADEIKYLSGRYQELRGQKYS